jgi:hypothetical protein
MPAAQAEKGITAGAAVALDTVVMIVIIYIPSIAAGPVALGIGGDTEISE